MIDDTPQVGRGCTSFRWANMLAFAKPKRKVCILRTSYACFELRLVPRTPTSSLRYVRTELQTIYSRRKLSGRPR